MLVANPPCPIHSIDLGDDSRRSQCSALTIGELIDSLVRCPQFYSIGGEQLLDLRKIEDLRTLSGTADAEMG